MALPIVKIPIAELDTTKDVEYKAKVKELEDAIASCEQAEKEFKNRPRGKWLSHYDYCKKHGYLPSGLITFWWCNQCEQGVEIQTNFCPNCGADMKEGEAE